MEYIVWYSICGAHRVHQLVPGLIRHTNQGVPLVVKNVRHTIRLALLVTTILTLPIDGAIQRMLGASVVFLRLQAPFVVGINNNVELNLSAVITSVAILLIIRAVTGARRPSWRGLAIIITPYPPAWLLMVYLITQHPGWAVGVGSAVAIATAYAAAVTAALMRIDPPTLYTILLTGSFITDAISTVMAGDIYHLGCFVIGYYGPVDDLATIPLFGVLLTLALAPTPLVQ